MQFNTQNCVIDKLKILTKFPDWQESSRTTYFKRKVHSLNNNNIKAFGQKVMAICQHGKRTLIAH